MSSPPFTILWDNDGVLVNTEGLYFEACQTVLASVGVTLTVEQFKEVSLRRGESTLVLASEAGVCDEEVERLRVHRNRLYGELLACRHCLVEGAEEVLRRLHGRVRMGIVTSSRRDHFEIAHARGGLLPYMDFVITHEEYQNSKPDPEPYLLALQRYHLRPERCVVIEDSQRGLAAATAAGLRCLIVLSDWTRDGDFPTASKVLESIRDVPGEVLAMAGI
jgi:HAD superfamily hydrolase (TIGR01509 family)